MQTQINDKILKKRSRRSAPSEAADEHKGAVYMLHDRITIKKDHLTEFIADAEEFLDCLQRERGWRLIAAAVSLTGRLNVVTHVWQIPDPDSLPATMHWLADAPKYGEIQSHIESETQELMLALIYDPKEPELEES
jgi:hypothetical protein